jgi:hypothetical protein
MQTRFCGFLENWMRYLKPRRPVTFLPNPYTIDKWADAWAFGYSGGLCSTRIT